MVILPASTLLLACVATLIYKRSITVDLRQTVAKIEAARMELAALEALKPEDQAWLAECQTMTVPSDAAVPLVGSVWEWQPGNPMAREVVTVKDVDSSTGLIWLEGSSGDRAVSPAIFAGAAVPATLKHRR